MNDTGNAKSNASNVPTDRKPTHSEDFAKRMESTLERVRMVRNDVLAMEARLFGGGDQNIKNAVAKPKEVFADSVAGNQDRLLTEIRDELETIENTVVHLREYA